MSLRPLLNKSMKKLPDFNRKEKEYLSNDIADYSQGYYDLSITNRIGNSPLITCALTTKTIVGYYFRSDEGQKSNLKIDDYGVKYILGFQFAVHTYDCEKTNKTVFRKMKGKSISDTMPNMLPSEKNYGFKTNISYDIYCQKIEKVTVFPIPNRELIIERPLFKETKNYKTPTKLKPIPVKHSDLGFQGRQTTKSTKKSGGRSTEFTNVSANNAYRSRLYKKGDQKYQFSISASGLVYYHLNNLPIQVIGQLQENKEGLIVLIPSKDLTSENLLTYERAKTFVSNENRLFTLAGRIKIKSYEESYREYKRRDKRRRRIEKSKNKAQLIYQT
jgi:hypothetical protein